MSNKTRDSTVGSAVLVILSILLCMGMVGFIAALFGTGEDIKHNLPFPDNVEIEAKSSIISGVSAGTGKYSEDVLTNIYENLDNITALNNQVVIGGNAQDNYVWANLLVVNENSVLEYSKNLNKYGPILIKNIGNSSGEKYVLETDIMWTGIEDEIIDDWFLRIGLASSDLGSDSAFMKAYIFGSGDTRYYRISTNYTSPSNDFVLVNGLWYCLRIEYTPVDRSYSLFVNNKLIESGTFDQGVDNSVLCGLYLEERSKLNECSLYLDNTYINAFASNSE